jgi:formate dehydrogenase
LPLAVEKELGVTYHASVEEMVKHCDVVTINCPLHPETENMFDAKLISKMKKGAYLVNTARGKIVDRVFVERMGRTSEVPQHQTPTNSNIQ